jgi:hypothetical protein
MRAPNKVVTSHPAEVGHYQPSVNELLETALKNAMLYAVRHADNLHEDRAVEKAVSADTSDDDTSTSGDDSDSDDSDKSPKRRRGGGGGRRGNQKSAQRIVLVTKEGESEEEEQEDRETRSIKTFMTR